MTREQQIKEALELLGCDYRPAVEWALDAIGNAEAPSLPSSKAATRAQRAYHRALCRLRATHLALVSTGWGGAIALTDIERAITATTPRQFQIKRARFEAIATYVGRKQERAVREAHALLTQTCGEYLLRVSDEFPNNCSAMTPLATTRGGNWWKLSAILYGDRDADLFRYLRAFAKYVRDKNMSARI